ncbi:alkylphosphonate utilization protein [Loktanella sp. D2R18]|uniref:alpha-D-ribose 1-methylphosphonate 5-triphosphate diphosphatase n=1 Tax=Rhodobacterales TaxID=204455 RepID=UPI000DEA16BD|nr:MULTISPECIES: alpha-D-ribose 1-methylphosphonate 5-triphosphate diphosphatase [Rhodobacterales]MDO6591064.1 alpha-D-ribose 1-methylphosphonate 5-triphosphate diphosphatase [Yoonia sp. 1_MG-2023]RBW42184.1 alkylphosphonate utilization protein [Loktanella sp. D2R18]
MTPPIAFLSMTGAQILRGGRIETGNISVREGFMRDDPIGGGPSINLAGYYILPGIIDLHGDAFEHHLAPRPTAPFPMAFGLAGTDRDAAANGVTTAWMAQSWSWEGGGRGPDFAEDFMQAHADYRDQMLTDLRIQIRCETHTVNTQDRLIAAIENYGIDYVIFNNHLDEALEIAKTHPDRIAAWAARAGRTAAEHVALVEATRDQSEQVPRYLCNLAAAFDRLTVRYGSHDDPDGRTREYYSMIGAKICEFPTQRAAAALANTWADPVIMGAPNVVRGGSQSGNIAAVTLIRDGLCDALVSDYHYPTLAQSAFALDDAGILDLAKAWAMISTRPARIMGLGDRGVIADGKRADLTIINATTRQVEGTMSAGRWSHLSAGLAHRLTQAAPRLRVAAE